MRLEVTSSWPSPSSLNPFFSAGAIPETRRIMGFLWPGTSAYISFANRVVQSFTRLTRMLFGALPNQDSNIPEASHNPLIWATVIRDIDRFFFWDFDCFDGHLAVRLDHQVSAAKLDAKAEVFQEHLTFSFFRTAAISQLASSGKDDGSQVVTGNDTSCYSTWIF